MLLVPLALLLATLVANSVGDVFTAMADMEKLLDMEKDVVGIIDQYIQLETTRLDELRKVAKSYQQKNKNALKDGSSYLSNPVNAFRIVKRLTSNWNDVESLMKENPAEKFLENITSTRDESALKFPSKEDLDGAAVALLRLQDVYALPTGEIAEGKIKGVDGAAPLTAGDCYELGRVAYNLQDYYHTLLWMQESLDRLEREKRDAKEGKGEITASESSVLEHLAFSMYQQGNLKHALQLTKRLFAIDKDHPRAAGNVKYYDEKIRDEGLKPGGELPPVVNYRPKDMTTDTGRKDYEALCRGDILLSPKQVSRLYCYYKTNHPFLRLAPLKAEVVHWKPRIIIFRQVMSDKEVERVKEIATPKLKRATVHNKYTGALEFASYRISKSAWLKDEDDEVVEAINRRINLMSGLDLETAELLQIANYGIGGHYDPHYDMSTKDEVDAFDEWQGNRIATTLIYMSQPDAGGATVFPMLKAAIFPVKGDAAFWFNILHNGNPDMTTRHAACPVLSGIKWVSNKWIHERGQEKARPCLKNKKQYYKEAIE